MEGTYFDTIPSATGGCDTAATIIITEQPLLTDTIEYLGCSGDGFTITVNGTIYDESNPTGTEIIDVPIGCDSMITIDLQFTPLTPAQINPEGPVCTASPVITLTATPAGGTWSGDVTSDQFDPGTLGPGTYEVIYTVSAGACSSADTIQITVYELIISCQAIAPESAPGANDGEGQVTYSGGIPDYTISWSGPSSGSISVSSDGSFNITGLTGGTYTVQVTDEQGCSATCQFTIIINEPCDVMIDNIDTQAAACSGVNNGSATINAIGSFPPFEYSLDGITYQSSNTFTGLAPGNYTGFVRDDNGCVNMQNFTIDVGASPQLCCVVVTDASCGVDNGQIEIDATGGTPPYNFSIDGVVYVLTGLFPGLGAGDYPIYLIDDAGCTDTLTVTVNAANAPDITISVTNASCGQPDGSITITATGGQGVLMYSINGSGGPFQTSNVFNGLLSGIYNVVVKDEAGCETPGTATINEIGGPVITSTPTTLTECDENTGTITVNATGVNPLMYSIVSTTGPFQTSNVFTGLGVGTYTVYVKDDNGCIATTTASIGAVNGPTITNVVVTHTTCGEDNGGLLISITGGTTPYEIFVDGISYNDETDIPDLGSGPHDIEVVDANGCSAVAQATINPSSAPDFFYVLEPAHCGQSDGLIDMDPDNSVGMPPFTYSINGAAGPFVPSFTFPNLPSDLYTLAIKDAKGCITEKDIFLNNIPGPQNLMATVTPPGCGLTNGIIVVTAQSMTLPLTYQLVPQAYQSSNTFNPVAPGTYTINVKDDAGCTATISVTVPSTPAPSITSFPFVNPQCGTNNGSITINATGGAAPLMYSINGSGGPFQSSNVFTGLGTGTYILVVKGTNGCEDTETVTLTSIGAEESNVSAAICDGDSYTIATQTFTAAGMYDVTISGGAQNGCDSIVHLTLALNPLVPETLDVNICVNEVFTYGGIDYSTPGLYFLDTVTAAVGCDTLLTLNLTNSPLEVSYLDTSICSGEVVTINGTNYSTSGEYVLDTLNAAVGCDSIWILRLTVDLFIYDTIVESICEGDIFTINGVDYTTTGIYLIDTFPSAGSCDTIRTLDLTVDPLPIVDAGPDRLLDCQVQIVTLDGSASSGGTPLWTGPGITAGNQNDLTPDVTQPGIYTLTLTSGQNCSSSDIVQVTLDPQSVTAQAGALPDSFFSCIIDTIILQGSPGGPNISYQWTGPGINASNEHQQNPIITEPGIYSLVVTDQASGCISAPDTVVITDISNVIVAIIQNPNSLDCYSDTIDLEIAGSSSGPNIQYVWFNEDGEIIGTSPGLEVSEGGMFVLLVQDTISGCSDNDSVFVKDLVEYPPVDAGENQIIDCNNPTVVLNQGGTNPLNLVFEWTGPPGGIITDPTALTVTVTLPGTYYLMATDTAVGCQNEDSVLVIDNTQLPVADIDIVEGITCIDSIALLDIGASSTGPGIEYTWTGPGINNVNSTMIEPELPGEYYLTVVNQTTGCINKDTATLVIPPLPTDLTASVVIPLCEGDSSGSISVLQVTGGTPIYQFSLNGGPSQSIPDFNNLLAGSYTLLVTDMNGCTYDESFVVPEGQLLTIDIGPDLELELGDSVILNPIVNLPWVLTDSLVWALGDHLSCTYCINPTLYALQSETITATVYAGGCVAVDMLYLEVDVDANVYVPNVFSPDGDGINDYVTVFTDDRVRRVVYLEIFDRWGNQVFVGTDFAPNDPLLGWDGSFKGKPMNPAVFAYIAKVELINGAQIGKKGDITLVR